MSLSSSSLPLKTQRPIFQTFFKYWRKREPILQNSFDPSVNNGKKSKVHLLKNVNVPRMIINAYRPLYSSQIVNAAGGQFLTYSLLYVNLC